MSPGSPWTRPTIVLVPGAWNSPGCYNLLLPLLETAGYTTKCVSLPSVGAQPPVEDFQNDVETIRNVIQEEADASHDVLLLMHGYGSIPGGEAVRGFDKITRSYNGLTGGVICLFYVAAPLLPAGGSFAEMLRAFDDSCIVTSQDQRVAVLERPIDILCPEVEPELAQEYVASLRPHSYQTFFNKTTWQPYLEIPSFCLFCRLDKFIPLGEHRRLVAATGAKVKSSIVNSGHCPFITVPEDMARAIRKAAKENAQHGDVIARDYGYRATS